MLLSESPEGSPKLMLADYLAAYEMEIAKRKAKTGTGADLMEMIRLKKRESMRFHNNGSE